VSDVAAAAQPLIGGGRSVAALLLSLFIVANVVLSHVATTCTMGNDDSWLAGVVVTAPVAVLQCFLLASTMARDWTKWGRPIGTVAALLTALTTAPMLFFGLGDAVNVFFRGGSLCGPGFSDYVTASLRNGLIAMYYCALPLVILRFAVVAAASRRNSA
jgi:hypothetical protein